MSQNIVFIPNVDLGDGRSSNYKYSINSWKVWGEKNNIKVIEWKDPITDPSYMKITLQRYWVHDILEHNQIEYDQVLIVDADTIIHPDCPNFFNLTKGKFSVVVNNGCYEWVTRSINDWGKALFQNQQTEAYANLSKTYNSLKPPTDPSNIGLALEVATAANGGYQRSQTNKEAKK